VDSSSIENGNPVAENLTPKDHQKYYKAPRLAELGSLVMLSQTDILLSVGGGE